MDNREFLFCLKYSGGVDKYNEFKHFENHSSYVTCYSEYVTLGELDVLSTKVVFETIGKAKPNPTVKV